MRHRGTDDPCADVYGSQCPGEGEIPEDDAEAAPLTERPAPGSAAGSAGRCAALRRPLGAAAGAAGLALAAWLLLPRGGGGREPAVSELLAGAAGVMVLAFHTEFSAGIGLPEAQLGYLARFARNCSEVHVVVEALAPRSLCDALPRLRRWVPARFPLHLHCVPRGEGGPSSRHAFQVNWAMQNIVAKRPRGSGSFLLLDGDIVLVRDVDLSVLVSDVTWTCLGQERERPESRKILRYCWPGLLSLSPEIANPLELDFLPIPAVTDTGGRISWVLDRHPPQMFESCDLDADPHIAPAVKAVRQRLPEARAECLGLHGTPMFWHLGSMTSTWHYNATFLADAVRKLALD